MCCQTRVRWYFRLNAWVDADRYPPELFFCCGTFAFGVFAVILGFIGNSIAFLVLRALTGIGIFLIASLRQY
jgi:hypothetical protein